MKSGFRKPPLVGDFKERKESCPTDSFVLAVILRDPGFTRVRAASHPKKI